MLSGISEDRISGMTHENIQTLSLCFPRLELILKQSRHQRSILKLMKDPVCCVYNR